MLNPWNYRTYDEKKFFGPSAIEGTCARVREYHQKSVCQGEKREKSENFQDFYRVWSKNPKKIGQNWWFYASKGGFRPNLWYNTCMSNTNTESKSILARLLANEDLSVVHNPSADTASFDLEKRVLTLPVWQDMSNSLYDMLVGHEVAHALYTPTDDWHTEIQTLASMHQVPYRIAQMYVNVVEDARIERMIKSQFPGLRRDFLNAYLDLMNRDLFDLNGRSLADLPLIDRLNLEFKVGLHAGETIPFAATEAVFVDRIQKAVDWSDVLDIANDLLASIIDEQEEQEQDETSSDDTAGGDEGDEGQSQGGGEATDEESDSSDSAGSSSAPDGDDDSDDGEESTSGSGSSEEQIETKNGKYVPESITEQAFSKVSDSLREEEKTGYRGNEETVIDPIDEDWNIIDYKRVHTLLANHWAMVAPGDTTKAQCDISVKDFVSKSRPAVMTMVKAFEMKKSADAHKRVQISKTGTLDTVKMMNYRWSEDVFRKTATIREGKNHGLVMFLDWSGSMCDQITETMEQLITLVLFCKKVNVPFEVYAFTSQSPEGFGNEKREWDPAVKNHNHYFSLLNLFSSRMKKNEFDAAIKNNYALACSQCWDRKGPRPTAPHSFSLGGTPLNEAILGAINIVPRFKRENNVQIVNTVFLTDGCGNGMHVPYGGFLKIKGDRIGVKSDGNATNMITKMLRDRTGCNVVNFFLANWGTAKFNRHACYYFETEKDLEAGAKTWKDSNYAISTSDRQGWDEQYLVRTVKVDNGGIQIDDNATVTKKRNAFLKSMKGRNASRVVLNRFIDMIA